MKKNRPEHPKINPLDKMNWTVIASFHQMNARRAVATVGSENIGSIRVLEKIGMFREAFYEKDVQLRDRWRDSYLYAVGREEFLRQKINESI